VLALWDGIGGLFLGCALIALGAGGVKPCVSAFVGDQFTPQQGHLLERMYGWFYFAINVGSLGGQFFIPKLLDWYRPSVAFAAPAVAMAIALVLYLIARKRYVKLPPTGPNPNGFLGVSWHALRNKGKPGESRLDAARSKFPEEAVVGVRATLRILLIFLLVSFFWALFFQFGSTWVLQAERMDLRFFGWIFSPAQLTTLNALFVLLLIPVMNAFYKARERRGRPVGALRKMTAGMFIASLSFVAAMVVESFIQRGGNPHALWQTVQYFLISLAEVLVSVTGLEFAYTQAPRSMKSTIMGFWFVAMSLGNVLTAAITYVNPFGPVTFFAFFAALMFVAACGFWFVARWYKPAYVEKPAPAPAAP
jgi:POT family proton-dependent oligopeptide transporter